MMLLPSIAFVCAILSTFNNAKAEEPVDFLSDAYIENLNKLGLPWKAGRNFAANLTRADLVRMFGETPNGPIPDGPSPSEQRKTHTLSFGESIPAEFDARSYFKSCSDIISVIPDQGACASSYAFAVTSVASDRLCIASKGKVQKLLSSEYVTSCCKICRYPESAPVCSGGLSSATWKFIHKRGLVTGGGYKSNAGCQPVSFPPCNHSPGRSSLPSCEGQKPPQPKCHTRCTNENYGIGFFQDKYKFAHYYWLDETVEHIQQEILKNGPVVANMYIYSDLLSYQDGVYTVSLPAKMIAYATVKIIGWGEEQGLPYWLVVSTFGEHFGIKGTFKILRGKSEAIIEELVSAALPRGRY